MGRTPFHLHKEPGNNLLVISGVIKREEKRGEKSVTQDSQDCRCSRELGKDAHFVLIAICKYVL